MGAEPRLACQRLRHSGGRVAIKQGALAKLKIDVVVAVDIPKIRPAAPLEVKRHRRLQLADTAVHAAGDAALGALKELLRFVEPVRHEEVERLRWWAGIH